MSDLKKLAYGLGLVVMLALLLAGYTLVYRPLAAAEDKYLPTLVNEVGIGLVVLLPLSLLFVAFLLVNHVRRAQTRGRPIYAKGREQNVFVGWETAEGEFTPLIPPTGSNLTHLSVTNRPYVPPKYYLDSLQQGEQEAQQSLPTAGDFEEERTNFEPERFFLGWMGE